jgi:hypothetical protein
MGQSSPAAKQWFVPKGIKGLSDSKINLFLEEYQRYLKQKNLVDIAEYLNIPIKKHAIEYLIRNLDRLCKRSRDTKWFIEMIT